MTGPCTCASSIRAEREAIAVWLEDRGQRWAANRIRAGEHNAKPGKMHVDVGPPYYPAVFDAEFRAVRYQERELPQWSTDSGLDQPE